MYTRLLTKPQESSFLLGPRGTGKSTWTRKCFPEARFYDLLAVSEQVRLLNNPSALYDELQHLKPGSWIVIDEIQQIPVLLNEVHRLMEDKRLRFLLCGSSARKLRRSGVNLLGGRAESLYMFPLVSAEIGIDWSLQRILQYGMLPLAWQRESPLNYLTGYVQNYLNEEIKQEALTRNIGAFARFLEIAARQNGQVTNLSNIGRDAHVHRLTVATYFDILKDTLIGTWLPAWRLKSKNRPAGHPKFYFFDVGVARALSGRSAYPPSSEERGALLETYILQELRAYLSYKGKPYPLLYWHTYAGTEVDIVFEAQDTFVAIEIKSSENWNDRYGRGLRSFSEQLGKESVQKIGVYEGAHRMDQNGITIFPVKEFLDALWSGTLIT